MSFALAQYQNARVSTVSPLQLVVQLYDGAIRFLREAVEKGASGDKPGRGHLLGRAHAILNELQATLDHAQAPELSAQLFSLYDFCLGRITQAVVSGEDKPVAEAIGVLENLRGAWAELARR
jgi:flagellar secretion chaperone FliS